MAEVDLHRPVVKDPLLTREDLILPNKASNIPGYNGYTPQLKFNCGHTYGYHTDKLTKRLMRNEKLVHSFPDNLWLKEAYLPKQQSDKIYVEKMVPGFTGYVPGHRFKFGDTYKEGTEDSIAQFKAREASHHEDQVDLRRTVHTYPKLQVRAGYPPADPSHPGVNVRYATAHQGKYFNNKREFTESPMPGYTGHVPKKHEHELGARYHTWSGNAFRDSLNMQSTSKELSMKPITLHRPQMGLLDKRSILLSRGNDLYKEIGMVPKYTGFVPQQRYRFGNTYGDTSRQLPVCIDSNGYATGKYNDPGPSN